MFVSGREFLLFPDDFSQTFPRPAGGMRTRLASGASSSHRAAAAGVAWGGPLDLCDCFATCNEKKENFFVEKMYSRCKTFYTYIYILYIFLRI